MISASQEYWEGREILKYGEKTLKIHANVTNKNPGMKPAFEPIRK